METFTDEIMRDLLASSLETATVDESGCMTQVLVPGQPKPHTLTG